jgi:hypothetical protein
MPTLDIVGGQLLGAFDVDLNGSLYDVTFVDGTCVGLFDGCDESSDFFFQDYASAEDASRALLDSVFSDIYQYPHPLGTFDSDPGLTSGCSYSNYCEIYTPYDYNLAYLPPTFPPR